MSQPSSPDAPEAGRILSDLLAEAGDLSRLMELVYFGSEPGLFEIARWLVSTPESERRLLLEFIAAAEPGKARIEPQGPARLVIRLE